MTDRRKVQVFSAGCSACDAAIQTVKDLACPSCDVEILDMHDPTVAAQAKALGIHRVPAVVIDGQLASCCVAGAVDAAALQAMGLGQG